MEKTRVGCKITTDFLMSMNNEDSAMMLGLMDKGFKELYYSAPYHWGLINPEKRRIVTYTEGDINQIDCYTKKQLIEEAEEHLTFIKNNYSGSPIVWKDGELLVEKLKRRR